MNAIEAMRGIDQTQRKVLVVSRKDDEFKGALVEVARKLQVRVLRDLRSTAFLTPSTRPSPMAWESG